MVYIYVILLFTNIVDMNYCKISIINYKINIVLGK